MLRRLARVTPYAVAEHDGLSFLAPTRGCGIGPGLLSGRSRPEFVVLGRAVQLLAELGFRIEGSTFVDVGAHIGTTTIPAVSRHGFARAIALEPDPGNARLLRVNAVLGDVADRVVVVEAAASSAPGRARFARGFRRGEPDDGVGSLELRGREDDVFEVALTTVDREISRVGVSAEDVGLLWLDVQGHEVEALTGATSLVDRRVPVVLAFRSRTAVRSEPVSALAEFCEGRCGSFVDLRDPHVYKKREWQSRLRPLESISTFVPKRASTDLLLVPAAG